MLARSEPHNSGPSLSRIFMNPCFWGLQNAFPLSGPSNLCFPLETIARMKPTPLTPSPPGVPSPSPLPHKLELQTLKLEELTVSLGSLRFRHLTLQPLLRWRSGSPARPLSGSKCSAPANPHLRPGARLARPLPASHPRSQSSGSSCGCGASRCRGPSQCFWSACAAAPRPANGRRLGARTVRRAPPGLASGPRLWEPPGVRAR